MFEFLKKLFKRKQNLPDFKSEDEKLEYAVKKGILRIDEFLQIRKDRAIFDYENFCKAQNIKIKK